MDGEAKAVRAARIPAERTRAFMGSPGAERTEVCATILNPGVAFRRRDPRSSASKKQAEGTNSMARRALSRTIRLPSGPARSPGTDLRSLRVQEILDYLKNRGE